MARISAFFLLTALALLIHGYHPYAEDAEIYLPGVQKILNPNLFPVNSEFFSDHAKHSFYPHLIASSVRITRLPLPWADLLWHLASIFLLLVASWRLATAFFQSESTGGERACWGAVVLMTMMLTLPIAGTALYIMDQYINPRNLAALAGLFALAEMLHRKYGRTVLWLALAAAVHPLMASFAILFCAWLWLLERFPPRFLGFAVALPFGITLDPPPAPYHEVALRQRSHFVLRWEWYEWLGVIGPVLLFSWLANWARQRDRKNLAMVSRAMVPFVLVASAAAIGLGSSPRLEALARLQPLRSMALCYMILVVAGGGLLGEYLLQDHVWRWLTLFLPLGFGMYFAQLQVFPASQHIELPGVEPRNPWAQAFEWIRQNTPEDALFALDPQHMRLAGEDENGFRARSERSMLADLEKDKGAASMFPPLSVKWAEQTADQKNWKQFGKDDFERLRQKYGVTWVVVEQARPPDSDPPRGQCPYENSAVLVCRIN